MFYEKHSLFYELHSLFYEVHSLFYEIHSLFYEIHVLWKTQFFLWNTCSMKYKKMCSMKYMFYEMHWYHWKSYQQAFWRCIFQWRRSRFSRLATVTDSTIIVECSFGSLFNRHVSLLTSSDPYFVIWRYCWRLLILDRLYHCRLSHIIWRKAKKKLCLYLG